MGAAAACFAAVRMSPGTGGRARVAVSAGTVGAGRVSMGAGAGDRYCMIVQRHFRRC